MSSSQNLWYEQLAAIAVECVWHSFSMIFLSVVKVHFSYVKSEILCNCLNILCKYYVIMFRKFFTQIHLSPTTLPATLPGLQLDPASYPTLPATLPATRPNLSPIQAGNQSLPAYPPSLAASPPLAQQCSKCCETLVKS